VSKLARRPRKQSAPRHLDTVTPWVKIVGAKPGYKYAMISKELQGSLCGPAYYEAIGWEFVKQGGSEKFLAGTTSPDTENMENMGMVLMRIREEDFNRIQREGDGLFSRGTRDFDETLRHIADRGPNGYNPLRSMGGLRRADGAVYASAENTTEDIAVET